MIKIDIHHHIEIPQALELIPEGQKGLNIVLGSRTETYQKQLEAALQDQLCNVERKISDLGGMRFDKAILALAPPHFFYHLDSSLALRVSRIQNDRISALTRDYPSFFAGMATVPLQDIDASVKELERAVLELGLKGVEVASNVRGQYTGSRVFWPFLEVVESLDIPIFIHPRDVAGAERLKDFYLTNLIGNPLDTTICAAHMIFSGTLDRFPRLKVILAHGGGQLPYIIGRLKHGFEVRPECKEFISRSPMEYLDCFYFDTITHDSDSLRFLISRVGADHVLAGTDYPYDMGDMNPVGTVDALAGLSEDQKAKILGRNAIQLFKL